MTVALSFPATMTAPGTSGRSPNPPRGAAAAAAAAAGGGTNAAGRSSIGSIASLSSVQGGGGNGPRSSIGSSIAGGGDIATTRGTRLSYGMGSAATGGSAITSFGAGGSSAMAAGGGITPAHRRPTSPPSTTSTNDNDGEPQSDFLAALSPTTAKFLRGRGFPRGGSAAGGVSAMTAEAGGNVSSSSSVSDAVRGKTVMEGNNNNKVDKDDVNMTYNVNHNDANATMNDQRMTNNNNSNNKEESETDQLRKFVRSLLGMHLPTTTSTSAPTMTTPDPATAAFFAVALLAKTDATSSTTTCDDENNGGERGSGRQQHQNQQHGCRWRPDDAYFAARALSLKGEHKRAIYILDKVGLIGFGISAGGEGDVSGGSIPQANTATTTTVGCNNGRHTESFVTSNVVGVRNSLLLRAESALLAGQLLVHAGEYDRALTVYEEAMRYPPPPPPVEWGLYGFGYRLDDIHTRRGNDDDNDRRDDIGEGEEEEKELNARLADWSYVHAWREQSLSHMSLIDDGDDERLVMLAANIRPMAFSSSLVDVDGHHQHASAAAMAMHGIHPVARLCVARGIAYDAISNPHRAVSFLKAAMTIDARCIEALDYVVKRRLLTPEEERSWVSNLNFGRLCGDSMSISWLRDAYLTRLRGMGYVSEPTGASDEVAATDSMISPVPRTELLSPSMFSLSSPDFAGEAVVGDNNGNQLPVEGPFVYSNNQLSSGRTTSLTIDGAFRNLAITHKLGRCPDVLSHAAIRSYALHDLSSALAYCTAIDAIDPFCRTAGYVHVATLVGLNLKRRLFHLAHRLVDTDPKDSLAWFAVGSYYYACRRFDLAQRHFSRATRLDPSNAECWIGFGCSFAVCDESDQALASFRAAQNKYSGSSVPLLYMGMEYLRTNHLSLAGHFLNSAQRTDPCDVLCCNELGVWCYRQGNLEDAAFWFMKALRLHVRAESSVLKSTDEDLGINGYILLTVLPSTAVCADPASVHDYASTPHLQRRSINDRPPMSSVLCAVKTPSGKSIAASFFIDNIDVDNDGLTDLQCIERCMDQCWEPAIFNLGQSYRKLKKYGEAIVCFEKCTSLNPVSWYLVDGVR